MAAFSVLAAVFGAERSTAALVLTLLAGIGGWIALAWPALVEWRRAGDRLRQAREVERLKPELRGRLVTAVAQVDEATGEAANEHVAQGLAALVVRRAAHTVAGLEPEQVHRSRVSLMWVAGASALWAVFLGAISWVPGGPRSVLDYWSARAAAYSDVAGVEVDEPEAVARVGDLLLRYTYPDYTGLEPRQVPNSTGEAYGPPGTRVEVTARSADVVEAAGLVAYGEALEATVRPTTDERCRQASGFGLMPVSTT